MKRHASSKNRLGRILILVFLLSAPLIVFWQRNNLYDAWRLNNYQAPPTIVSLADQVKMTDPARRIFYVNHPQLLSDANAFRQACKVAEQTIILGCYHGPQSGIYVYSVQDERLSGIQQVTAAHEMLHAAYDRLSASDRKYVDKLLLDYYEHDLNNDRISKAIDSYKKTEPNDVVNEMHSIFGTEIAELPDELEQYYKRYFTDRSAVIGFSANYEQEFTSRDARMKEIEAQLKTLQEDIKSQEESLKAEYASINARRSELDGYRSSGQTAAYNAAVDSFNAQVEGYNARVAAYQADVRYYNQLVSDYNAVAGDLRELYDSINANLQTADGQ